LKYYDAKMVTCICVVTCYKHDCEGSSSETHLGIVLGNVIEGTEDAKSIAPFANLLSWTLIFLKCFFTESKKTSDMPWPCGMHSVNRFHLNNSHSSSMSGFNFYMLYSFGTLLKYVSPMMNAPDACLHVYFFHFISFIRNAWQFALVFKQTLKFKPVTHTCYRSGHLWKS
jgi:hypothetical protein